VSARKRPAPQQWPADTVERWPTDRPKPFERNARTHSPAQITHLAKLITEYGWTMPLLCDEKDNVLAGHGRLLAARELGLPEVPVIVARGWSAAQKKAYRLADNQSALLSTWDAELLRSEIGDLRKQGINLELAGFTPDSLRGVFPRSVEERRAVEGDPHFEIVVSCADEAQQRELLEQFNADGLKCRALIG
jgi:ParB/Sulfiredoxin domain